jgi:predicted phosphodiesterase
MASKSTESRLLVEKYCGKHKNMPTLTLAKLIYSEKPDYFKNVEHVRDHIRYVRGLSGDKKRSEVKNKELLKPKEYKYNPFEDFPDGDDDLIEPIILPKVNNKILVLSDIHIPFHDTPAIKAAVKRGIDQKVNTVILNGDILDIFSLSTHEKRPNKALMQREIAEGKLFLEHLRKSFPTAKIYYTLGNHEHRLQRWLFAKAPEWLGTEIFEIRTLLEFGKYKIQEVPNQGIIMAGKLAIYHGDLHKGGGGVQPARWVYLKARSSALIGHFHRTSNYIDKDLHGVVSGAWSAGCLCKLNPEYLRSNQWNHGAVIVSVENDGTFNVDNFIIDNGKVL